MTVVIALTVLLPNISICKEKNTLITETFRECVQKATHLFISGYYLRAFEQFEFLNQNFSNEAEYNNPKFQNKLLPVMGYTYQISGHPYRAIEYYKKFLTTYKEPDSKRAFVMFNLARIYRKTDDLEKAVDQFIIFEKVFAHLPEAALAVIERAEILYQQKKFVQSVNLLNSLYESNTEFSLPMQARLKALQYSISGNQQEAALNILLNTKWDVNKMPDIAALSFSALKLGNILLKDNDNLNAIRCYRLTTPLKLLITAQRQRIQKIKNYIDQSQSGNQFSNSFRVDYYKRVYQRLNTELENLKSSEDYTPLLQMRLGQAMLMVNRLEEAWLIFENLTLTESNNIDLQNEAHYRWIVTARTMKSWDDAITLAKNFNKKNPDSAFRPLVLQIMAEIFQEQKKYREAVEILSGLIALYPDNIHKSRWIFNKGFNLMLAEKYEPSRLEFEYYQENFPKGNLYHNAQLWHALSSFFEKNYQQCLDELNEMIKTTKGHHLYPEILYRKAALFYTMRDYNLALKNIKSYQQKYSDHHRYIESQILLGDILMGKGQLHEAIKIFTKVNPEVVRFYTYASFQIGKCYQSLEKYNLLIDHFKNYIAENNSNNVPRIAEALYWLGWSYEKLDMIDSAFPLYIKILNEHGNNLETDHIEFTLSTLEKYHKKFLFDNSNSLKKISNPFGNFKYFNEWLEFQSQKALQSKNLIYYSRLQLYLSKRYQKSDQVDLAESIILKISNTVPLASLDAQCLGEIGLLKVNLNLNSAKEYFTLSLEAFPNSRYRNLAYIGLSKLHLYNENHTEALIWLRQSYDQFSHLNNNIDAILMYATTLLKLKRNEDSIHIFEDLLKRKKIKSRYRAEALGGIAKAYQNSDEPKKAIAYYQRVYNLYRAHQDIQSNAYLESALLLEKLGESKKAYETLVEMLKQEQLKKYESYTIAQNEFNRLSEVLQLNAEIK